MVKKAYFLKALLIILILTSINAYSQKHYKIVSLAPNWTNITAALGAADDLAGVTRYCIFPDSIPRLVKEKKIEIVAGFTDVNYKRIKELKPDLILTCTGVQAKIRDKFVAEGYKVIHMEETSVQEVYDKIAELGAAIDRKANAEALVTEIKGGLNKIADAYKDVPKVRVYYEINYYYKCSPGKDSYITELIRMAGGEPVFADRPGIAPSNEWSEVVKANPDVILIPIWEKPGGPYFEGEKVGWGTTTPSEIAHREGAQQVNAVKNCKVRYINSAKTKQAGPQMPVAAELFAKTLHAEGDPEILKMDKVPDNMETAFSDLFYFFPFIINQDELCMNNN